MIFDCFSFFNELDILEIRLNVLNDVVDKFVIAESTLTHSGQQKPLYFLENKKRFKRFTDKIIHITIDDFPTMPNGSSIREQAWIRENIQRNILDSALPANPSDNDFLIVSDVDEIPNPAAVKKAIAKRGITRLGTKMYFFFINYRDCSCANWSGGPQIARISDFRNPARYRTLSSNEYIPAVCNDAYSMSKFRSLTADRFWFDCGWHFSYLGGIAAIQQKIKALAHIENNTDEFLNATRLMKCIAAGVDIFGRGHSYCIEPLDSSFPEYIVSQAHRYSHLIAAPSFIASCSTRKKQQSVLWQAYLRDRIVQKAPQWFSSAAIKAKKFLLP